MAGRRYQVYDVFTDRALAGNPLAVVFDCEGLDTAAMQAIAGEFNLSETVFVLPAENPVHRARLRIFATTYEMPFAGHPTVGSAVALAEQEGMRAGVFVLEENIGPVRCAVAKGRDAVFAEFDLPKLPEQAPLAVDKAVIASALGLGAHRIGFENHVPGLWSAGVPYVTVPVADLAAMAEIAFDAQAWASLAPRRDGVRPANAYLYCRQTELHDSAFHARMLVGGSPSFEDPATGSALAAFSGAVVAHDRPVDGQTRLWIEQGFEMGRPSRLRLELEVSAGRLSGARIGGHAVRVAEGTLLA